MKMIRDYFSYEHFYVIYCPDPLNINFIPFFNQTSCCKEVIVRYLLGVGLRPRLLAGQG